VNACKKSETIRAFDETKRPNLKRTSFKKAPARKTFEINFAGFGMSDFLGKIKSGEELVIHCDGAPFKFVRL
jgi:hypothetical protein